MILLRTLHKDIARYNQIDSGEDAQEEFGWKLVHGDVFRYNFMAFVNVDGKIGHPYIIYHIYFKRALKTVIFTHSTPNYFIYRVVTKNAIAFGVLNAIIINFLFLCSDRQERE